MSGEAGPPDQAVLLAAGLGERLRPLTEDRAKPALPLMNHPLILHALEHLRSGGVRRVAVNLHHAPDSLRSALEARPEGSPEVALSPEARILGTGGGVAAARRHLDPGAPLIVANADALSDLDLGALARGHRGAVAAWDVPATLAVRPRRPEDPYTPVWLDSRGAICGIGGSGSRGEPHVFMGIQILEPGAIAGLSPERPSCLVKDLYIPHLAGGGRLGAVVHGGWWVEIGSPALYRAAHVDLLGREGFLCSLPAAAGAIVRGLHRVFAHASARLEGAEAGESIFAARTLAGRGSRVVRTLVGPGAAIGRGAWVEDSIVWEGASVGEGERVEGSLVMAGGGAPVRMPLR